MRVFGCELIAPFLAGASLRAYTSGGTNTSLVSGVACSKQREVSNKTDELLSTLRRASARFWTLSTMRRRPSSMP
jgi:hypothetical protein